MQIEWSEWSSAPGPITKLFQHVIGTFICLWCLLEGGRYDEFQELLAARRVKYWSSHKFGAEALVRDYLPQCGSSASRQ